MTVAVRKPLNPRKTPVQARSILTVEAIMEATVQVLLTHGMDRLTTTRVAERAGVSVGTLYQYYPNKQALLFALLEQKLETVSSAVERACRESHGKPLAEMVRHVVTRFVDAKLARADISTALYRISADVGGPELIKRVEARSRAAIAAMLATAPGTRSRPEPFAVQMLLASMSGVTRSVLEAGASPTMIRKLREHLIVLCESYLQALSAAASG